MGLKGSSFKEEGLRPWMAICPGGPDDGAGTEHLV